MSPRALCSWRIEKPPHRALHVFACLTPNPILFSRLARELDVPSREVDGPFFLWRGERGGVELSLYLIEEGGADAAYAATRLAARRGAQEVLYVSDASVSEAAAEERSWGLGEMVSPEGFLAANALGKVIAFLPDSARELPGEIPAGLLQKPLRTAEGDPGILAAGMDGVLRNPWLADELYRRHGVALWDHCGAGVAAGCQDSGIPLEAMLLITSAIRQSHEAPPPAVDRDLLFEAVARELFPRAAATDTEVEGKSCSQG